VNVLSGAPYGYRYIRKTDTSDSCYTIVEDEAAVVRQIYQWYAQEGLSIGEIARRLSARGVPTRKNKPRWERSVVWAILRNPAYVGRAAFGKTERAERKRVTRPLRQKGGFSRRCSANRERPREQWIEIAVPALVDEPVFARAQERLAENKRLSPKNTKELTLLQGLLVCAQCGYGLYRTSTRTTRGQAKYYRCLGADRWRHLLATACSCRPIRVEDLDEAVWSQVERLLEESALVRAELQRRRNESMRRNPLQQRRQRLQQDLQRVGQQIDKLLDAYQEGLLGLAELRQRMPGLRKKQSAAQKELEGAHWQALADAQLQQLDQSLESFLGRLKQSAKNLGVAEKQKIIRLLVKEVLVEKDAITVRHCIPLSSGGGNGGGTPAVSSPTGPSTPAAPIPKEQSSGQDYQVCPWRDQSALGQPLPRRAGLEAALRRLGTGALRRRLCRVVRHVRTCRGSADDDPKLVRGGGLAVTPRQNAPGGHDATGRLRLPGLSLRTRRATLAAREEHAQDAPEGARPHPPHLRRKPARAHRRAVQSVLAGLVRLLSALQPLDLPRPRWLRARTAARYLA
jgi:site-specific DNA recombinase